MNSSLHFIIHHIDPWYMPAVYFNFVLLYSMENRAELGRSRMYNSGGSREGALPPSFIFRSNRGPKSRKKNWDPHPLISGSGWPSPPPLSEGLDPPLYKALLLNFSQFEKKTSGTRGFSSLTLCSVTLPGKVSYTYEFQQISTNQTKLMLFRGSSTPIWEWRSTRRLV